MVLSQQCVILKLVKEIQQNFDEKDKPSKPASSNIMNEGFDMVLKLLKWVY